MESPLNPTTSRVSPCTPTPAPGGRGDVVPATIIILVVVLSTLWLATLGMTAAAIGTLLTATTTAAGYLVRQLRGTVTR